MKNKLVAASIIILMFLTLGAYQTQAGVWVDVKTVRVTNDHVRSTSTSGNAHISTRLSGNNQITNMDASKIWIWESRAKATIIFDMGYNGISGGVMASESRYYRAKLHTYLSGNFDDNDNSNTYFKVVLKLFYMDGSVKHYVSSTTYSWNSGDVDFNYYKDFYTNGYIPANHYFYLEFTYELSADMVLFQEGVSSSLTITSYTVTYSYYVSGPIE